MTAAITTEGLGKRYEIGQRNREAYSTLRDTIANGIRLRTRDAPPATKEFWALRDVSFDVNQGDVVGIIGRNGAGKSTLLKLLSRITEPTTGRIRIRGRVASLLEVGTGFHPELTGRENIYLNGAILGMSRKEITAKFDEIVDFAEVEEFLETPVKRYSSGMYVRLAFAVAANLDPEVLIVDEVLAVGDSQFQRKCLGKMKDFSTSEGRTVLFVSHSMASVRALCTSALWLDHGQVRLRGSSLDVIRAYLESSMEEAESTQSLEEIKRAPGQGERLMITRVTLNDGQSVQHGERLDVQIEYDLREPAPDVAFGVGFSSPEGVRMLSIDSDLGGERHDLAVPHSGSVRLSLPSLRLQPGRYGLDLGARSGDHVGLDYLPACAWIDVLPGPNTPAVIIRDTGGVREPADWNWEMNSSSESAAG
ncbi:MAG TPA: ABC transporter ATP-binding protein [Gemmatimonadaceae bacterium]|nr:ABC transporter ATP-binding protein [Gemmatimonadaceae bacterium]